MPSAQKLLDRGIELCKENHKHGREKRNRNFCLRMVCDFLKDLCIQPVKVIRAIQCLLNPGNEEYLKKHNEVKVYVYHDLSQKVFS